MWDEELTEFILPDTFIVNICYVLFLQNTSCP